MAGGAGERPAKSYLTSPVCVLSECPPLWRAFACLASKCSKNAYRDLPDVPEMARVCLLCCVDRAARSESAQRRTCLAMVRLSDKEDGGILEHREPGIHYFFMDRTRALCCKALGGLLSGSDTGSEILRYITPRGEVLAQPEPYKASRKNWRNFGR